MVPLDRAMTSSCRALNSNHVFIGSGLAAILNATLLPAAYTHVRRISYRIVS